MKNISFSQGTAGSCQTLAAIGAIAGNSIGQKKLNEICKPVADGFEIRFGKYPDIAITVSNAELVDWTDQYRQEREQDLRQRLQQVKEILPAKDFFLVLPQIRPLHVLGDKLVRVLELAYVKLMVIIDHSLYPEYIAPVPGIRLLDLYYHKNFHYDPGRSINDITNWPVAALIANGGLRPELSKSFAKENKGDPTVIDRACAELAEIAQNPDKYVSVVSSVGTLGDSWFFLDPGTKIVPYHDHVIKQIDPESQTICLIDPFSSRIGLVLEYSDFLQYFNMITKAIVTD